MSIGATDGGADQPPLHMSAPMIIRSKGIERQPKGPSGPVILQRLLAAGLAQSPDAIATAFPDCQISWQELDQASTRYASSLLATGLKSGDRAATLMPNSPALIIHYLACFKSGIVAVPLNYRYTPPEIDYALRRCGASVLLADSARQADISASVEAGELRFGIISSGEGKQHYRSFEMLAAEPASTKQYPLPSPEDPAVIFFSSGSTGPAKGVTHSQQSLGWVLATYMTATQMTSQDAGMATSSISHIGGFIDAFCPLASGGRAVIAPSFDPESLLQMVRLHRPTIMFALPVALFNLVRHHDVSAADFSSLRLCSSGGDKVSAELHREAESRLGIEIYEQYGMTETGMSTIHPVHGQPKSGPIGKAIAGYTLSVRDDAGRPLPDGSEGQLWIKSCANMIGYWGDQEATNAVLQNGWLDTGDVVKIDSEEYVWFCGRRKQLIIHDGSNISPQEVENALLEHPGVEHAGVIGLADPAHGENVAAFVTLKNGYANVSPLELIAFARARVGYKAPESVSILQDMPLTSGGKVDRLTLKSLALEEAASC